MKFDSTIVAAFKIRRGSSAEEAGPRRIVVENIKEAKPE